MPAPGRVCYSGSMRLFIAIPIPDHIRPRLREALQSFHDVTSKDHREDRWHVTLLFLGEVEETADFPRHLPAIAAALPKLYIPTVTLTHAGRGKAPGQLWAYAQPTGPLMEVQITLRNEVARVLPERESERRAFVPHIRLASLKPEARDTALADWPLGISFAAREAELVRSEVAGGQPHYQTLGNVRLVP